MKPYLFAVAIFALSCGPQAAKGGKKEASKSEVANNKSDFILSVEVEATPVGKAKQAYSKEEKITVEADSVAFEIFFWASACQNVQYGFEKRSDTLLVLRQSGECYRHTKEYGVKGVIKYLRAGRYQFIISLNSESILSDKVFQKEIVVK